MRVGTFAPSLIPLYLINMDHPPIPPRLARCLALCFGEFIPIRSEAGAVVKACAIQDSHVIEISTAEISTFEIREAELSTFQIREA